MHLLSFSQNLYFFQITHTQLLCGYPVLHDGTFTSLLTLICPLFTEHLWFPKENQSGLGSCDRALCCTPCAPCKQQTANR